MTLTVHHSAKIHQWCRKPIKSELKYDLGKHTVTGGGLKACSTSQAWGTSCSTTYIIGPLTAALQHWTSYIQAYYFRFLTLTAATWKLYTNKSMNCTYTCHITTQLDISPYKALQRDTPQETTSALNLNCLSHWGCLLLAFPSTTPGQGLTDLKYLLSLWMYVECKDVCNNFQIKNTKLVDWICCSVWWH